MIFEFFGGLLHQDLSSEKKKNLVIFTILQDYDCSTINREVSLFDATLCPRFLITWGVLWEIIHANVAGCFDF